MNKKKGAFVAIALAGLAFAGVAVAIPEPIPGYDTHHTYYSDASHTTVVGTETWACYNVHLLRGKRSGYMLRIVSPCREYPPVGEE